MHIQVNGAAIYCYTGGKAFDAAKPTVVFIHGVLNDHSVWALQSRYTSPTTAGTCWPSTCPATASSGGDAPATVEQGATSSARCWMPGVQRGAGGPQLGFAHCHGSRRAAQGPHQPSGAGGHGLPDEGVARAHRGLADRSGEGDAHGQCVLAQYAFRPHPPSGLAPGCLARAWRWGARCCAATRSQCVPPGFCGLRQLRGRRGGHGATDLPGAVCAGQPRTR